jgi:ubiquinone/menaquinone biosynthesis C-methylase UbiE
VTGTVAHESSLGRRVRTYWDSHIHDLAITRHEVGSSGFFADLDQYHFEKLHHLQRLADFTGPPGRRVLDVGCGTGVDLVHFARGGASATGVDASQAAIRLASKNLGHQHLHAHLLVADGEDLPFRDRAFDYVFAHGVIQYTADDARLVNECRRVLQPGGRAFFQVYNRISWLNALSKLMKVDLEHVDAPVIRTYTHAGFRRLLAGFSHVQLVTERFPVKSRLHGGWKGALFNHAFVGTFNALPRRWVERYGWHLIAICTR